MRLALRALLTLVTLATFACSAENRSSDFKEGDQYKEVRDPQKVPDPRRVLVEEIFWYGCQHCFHFDPNLEAWRKTKAGDVDFVRIPNSLGRPEGVVHQKTFYAAEALGVSDKIHTPLFDGIHQQQQPLYTQDAIRAFFVQTAGVKPEAFDAAYSGFATDSRVRRADSLMKSYAITSVPALVVGGKYTTSPGMNGGDLDNTIKCLDFLVAKVRSEQKK